MKDRLQVSAMPAPLCLTLAAIACCAQCRVLVSRKADAHAVQQQLAFSRGDAHQHCLFGDSQGLALRRSRSMMSAKAAAGVYCVHQTQPRCGALTMQTTTSISRRAAATPTAATHGHHFSTKVAVQHRLQHVNDRISSGQRE